MDVPESVPRLFFSWVCEALCRTCMPPSTVSFTNFSAPAILQSAQCPQDWTDRDFLPQLRGREPSRATPDATRDQRRIPAHPSSSLGALRKLKALSYPCPHTYLVISWPPLGRSCFFYKSSMICSVGALPACPYAARAGRVGSRSHDNLRHFGKLSHLYPSPAYSSALMGINEANDDAIRPHRAGRASLGER